MHGNIVPQITGQAALTLGELANRIKDAHAGFVTACSNAIAHAIDAGQALILAKDQTPHGQWLKFLKQCDLGERQGERYAHLARLVEANPSSRTDLTGLSIQAAIKKLAPPKLKPAIKAAAAPRATAVKSKPPVESTSLSSLAWSDAAAPVRSRFVSAVGLQSLFEAADADQREHFAAWFQQQSQPPVAAPPDPRIPADLSIPTFLKREPEA